MSFRLRSPRLPAARQRRSSVRRGFTMVAVAAATAGLTACSGASAQTSPAGSQDSAAGGTATAVFSAGKGPLAPRVTGTTLTGAQVSLSRFRGHVLVVNFWGSWCTPCREEARTLSLLSRQYSSAGVKFLGVDVRDSRASAQAYEHDYGITYPSLSDPGGQVALAFRTTVPPSAIPTTVVISGSGRVTARVIGPVSYDGLRGLISTAMAQAS